jgi:trigger factor
MNITRENKDDLNAVLTVAIEKDDYTSKVDDILKNYKKSANIPGFRKGHVPMGLIKKQYGKAVLAEEVNKLIQDSIQKYINEEKLDVLGYPVPVEQPDFSWDTDGYTFEFEVGLSPAFEIPYKNKKAITHYVIEADQEMVDSQLKLLQRQYGKIVSQTEVKEGFTITGKFTSNEAEIENETSLKLEAISKENKAIFLGAKVGETIEVPAKGLFTNENDAAAYLGVDKDKAAALDVQVNFDIQEISEEVPAELNQELFDKYAGEGKVTSVDELTAFIKEQASQNFVQHSDQQLLNQVVEYLLEEVKFDLPAEFLQKWIRISGEEELTYDAAKEEYEKSEKGIRYQLIESKLIKDNELKVTAEEVKQGMKDRIQMQMAQYGAGAFPDEQLEQFANQMLSNQDEVRKMSEQVMNGKLIALFKEKFNLKEKKVSFKEFTEEAYQ